MHITVRSSSLIDLVFNIKCSVQVTPKITDRSIININLLITMDMKSSYYQIINKLNYEKSENH